MRYAAITRISMLAFVLVGSVSTLPESQQMGAMAAPPGSAVVMERISGMPLSFTRNDGQWNEGVLFRADAGGALLWYTTDGVYYQFTRCVAGETVPPAGSVPMDADRLAQNRLNPECGGTETICIKASFVGSNPAPAVTGVETMEFKCNYFLGNNPAQWRTDVPNYRTLVYRDVYDGIDLKYYGTGDGRMEYDFVVRPGMDVAQIQIRYEGATSLTVDDQGRLVVSTPWMDVIENRPYVYQDRNGTREEIGGEYVLLGEGVFGFVLDECYEPSMAVVIDPALSYSTYLGGGNTDQGLGIAVDGSGSAYVVGNTYSTDFPTANPFQSSSGGGNTDIFVTKLNPSGTALEYSTYIGGSNVEVVSSYLDGRISVDGSGCAYVAGLTTSSNFPTANPFQSVYAGGNGDAFVTKLSATGNALVYSTYLGGMFRDVGCGVAIDGNNDAYVTGRTQSTDFPTVNPFQATIAGSIGDNDVFVTKLNASGTALVYSTYLGGTATDNARDIAVDASNCAYVTGETESADFPTENPFQAAHAGGGSDVFVTKLDASGSSLAYSTYLGGDDYDIGRGIAVDATGSAYLTGVTHSNNFPTANPFQASSTGFSDAYVTKLSVTGNALVYSTYLGGGDNDDEGYGIAVDGFGQAYVTGWAGSHDFPIVNPFQATMFMAPDVFVTKFNASGSALRYSTYLGGAGSDEGLGIALDASGSAYVTGQTSSTSDFPTENPVQASSAGGRDMFVAKLQAFDLPIAICKDVVVDANASCQADASIDDGSYDPDGGSVILTQIPPGPFAIGTHAVTLIVTDEEGEADTCNSTVTVEDNTPPSAICQNDTTVQAGAPATGATVNYHAHPEDNCFGQTMIYTPPSGSFFPEGTTLVTCIAKDAVGNEDTCYIDVTVVVVCSCPNQCDYDLDGFLTSLDLSAFIDVLFAGRQEEQDPECMSTRGDFDCDGFPTSLDLSGLIDHLFAGADPPCDPCAP